MTLPPSTPDLPANSPRFCPQCGAPLVADAPSGLCPRCIMGLGFAARRPLPGEVGDTRDWASHDAGAPSGAEAAVASPSWNSLGGRAPRFIPPAPQELAPHFPHLEVLELVGQGGMGAVYRARQRGLDRIVALKILPPDAATDAAFAERFHREARALARLSHPHIVTVYDSGRSGAYFYFVMEYVDGVTLRQAMRAGQVSPREALQIIPQICEALQYAHDEGVVHRDIKPENVLVDRKGRVKVADFGLAKLLSNEPLDVSLTGTYQVVGTPRYMAPEQMEGAKQVDHRADIYSLGVVFYELLTGELPLGRFPVPSQKAQVTSQLDEVVLRTLEKSPQARYQQASELKSAVERLSGVGEGIYRDSSVWGLSSSPNSPSASSSMSAGGGYRSHLTLLGLPWIDVATGIDPHTGMQREARGVIAVGGRATGVVAIGGIATGGLAIGGVARGVVAMGGLAVGLFSFGGLSLGLLLAAGGCAVGAFAVGGLAVGVKAQGGLPLGGRVAGTKFSRGPLTPAEAFWDWVGVEPTTLVMGLVLLGALVAFLVARQRRKAERAEEEGRGGGRDSGIRSAPPAPPAFATYDAGHAASPDHGTWLWWLFLLVPLTCVGTAVLPLGLLGLRSLPAPAPIVSVDSATATEEVARPRIEDWNWKWTSDGPRGTKAIADQLSLSPAQAQALDDALKTTWEKYLQYEVVQRSEPMGTQSRRTVTLGRLTAEKYEELENLFWTELDPKLTQGQQSLARYKFRIASHTQGAQGLSVSIEPGLLGWGMAGAKIEAWQVGQWRHWRVDTPIPGHALPEHVRSFSHEAKGPELPAYLGRLFPGTQTRERPALKNSDHAESVDSR
ncbi:MAG: serine/threonine-protein kinase [Pirellulales bacterium]